MARKLLKILLGIFATGLLVIVLFISVRFAIDRPVFAEGPAPTLGQEMGAIDPETAQELQRLFEESGVPSLAAAIVVGDELVWAKGYGQQPDLSTVYMIGSIDKTIIATAILQLWEQGLIDLDDDINDYLPYAVRHPQYPDVPITVRMLLTHTSGLPHDVPGTNFVHNKDGPMVGWELVNQLDIDSFREYLFPPSDRWVEEAFAVDEGEGPDFWLNKPGIGYQYSNTGFYMLLLPIIEEVSGQPYADYIQENIFTPLGMESASYDTSSFPKEQLAVPYEDFSESGMGELPLTGLSASGKIRMNVIDMATYLLAHMNQGSLGDRRILEPESAALMHERQRFLSLNDFPPKHTDGIGLSWFSHGGGYQGHSGFVPGLMTEILYNDNGDVPYGMVIMMTKSHSKTEVDWDWWRDIYVSLVDTLLQEAKAVAAASATD